MSGQWEVVGKNKKDKQSGKSKKNSKNELQKFVENAPKVEDLLPLAQVKTLYSSLDSNKEVSNKATEKAAKTKENENKNKGQKKVKGEKKESSVKENNKPPKTIEAAVALITLDEVLNVLEVGQTRFAEAPLVWLKGFASWLNGKLPVDHTDNTFTAKSWEYPLCLLSADIRSALKKVLKGVPDATVQLFFDYCLTSMANEMVKGSPVSGYKILIQLVASQQPSVVGDLTKASSLRHSYQNRPAIGCSVMWALGQTGFKDLPTGLQVWLNVMYPVLELRNYSQFVCDYLKHLLARHLTSKAVTARQYFDILDVVRNCPHNNINVQLISHVHTLQGILNNSMPAEQLHKLFKPLLLRLNSTSSLPLKNQLVQFLTWCLTEDGQSFAVWRQLYTSHLPQSVMILAHIRSANCDWSKNMKHYTETIKSFKVTNDQMSQNKLRSEGLMECSRLCNDIIGKMAEKKSSSWKFVIFFILSLIGLSFAIDIKLNGSFEGSKTRGLLKDIGGLEYCEQAASTIKVFGLYIFEWIKRIVFIYMDWIRPYLDITVDFVSKHMKTVLSTSAQFCLEKKPIVEEWLNQYFPGLQEGLSTLLWLVLDIIRQSLTKMVWYLYEFCGWIEKHNSIGDLQNVTFEAFDYMRTAVGKTLTHYTS